MYLSNQGINIERAQYISEREDDCTTGGDEFPFYLHIIKRALGFRKMPFLKLIRS